MLDAGVHASHLGIALLDADTRFETLNAALARETRAPVDEHIGRNSREIVGELATQIEPTYEKVLRTGQPASVWLAGQVRDTQETGYWFDYCFPIVAESRRVQQLGLLVVNVTAETASAQILSSLTMDSKFLAARASGVLERFDEAIRRYHFSLSMSLRSLACPMTEAGRRVDDFRSSLQLLDDDIRRMRELIYAVVDQFSVPLC
jgi:PAS domain-containing protein